MTTVRTVLIFAAVCAAISLGAVGCGAVREDCTSVTCAGCCDDDGLCQPGFVANACGTSGNVCMACLENQFCSGGMCITINNNTGGKTDGGTDGGFDPTGDGGTNNDGGTDGGFDGGFDAGFDGGFDAGTKVGDNCSDPSQVSWVQSGNTWTASGTGTTTGYVNDTSSASCGGTGPDRVYEIVIGSTMDLTVTITSTSGLSPVVYVTGSSCMTGEVICGSPNGSTAALTYTGLQAGTYYVWVDGLSGSSGSYSYNISVSLPPAVNGDQCTSPNSLSFFSGTATASGDTTGAVNDISTTASGCSSATGGDIFYTFFNPSTADFTATVSTTSSTYRPVVYLRSSCSGTTQVCNVSPTGGQGATITAASLPAGTYYLIVDGAVSTSGPYTLTATLGGSSGTQGESCSNPKPLTFSGTTTQTATATGDTTGAANNFNQTCKNSPTDVPRDHVYSFTLSSTRTVTVTATPGANYDLGVILTNSPCGNGTVLSCMDEKVDGVAESIPKVGDPTLTLSAGTYYVWISGWTTSEYGPYTLNVTLQ